MADPKVHPDSASRKPLTVERLRELLHYDPGTGVFTWLNDRRGGIRAGQKAGGISGDGYIAIGIDGCRYLAHRLAWFYVTGEWPTALIDHKDTCPSNNRFANLREASDSQNQSNRPAQKNNTSGIKGVSFSKRDSKWQAHIRFMGKPYNLGLYRTKEEAAEAYADAARRFFGEFVRGDA